MDWTTEATDLATGMWTTGSSASEISKALQKAGFGVPTRSAVIGKMNRLGIGMAGRNVPRVKESGRCERRTMLDSKGVNLHIALDRRAKEQTPLARWEDAFVGKGEVSIMDARLIHCRWPFGDIRNGDFAFCGHEVRGDGPYCGTHADMAFVKPTGRVRAPYEPTPRRNSR